jgi:hypothetical protein
MHRMVFSSNNSGCGQLTMKPGQPVVLVMGRCMGLCGRVCMFGCISMVAKRYTLAAGALVAY